MCATYYDCNGLKIESGDIIRNQSGRTYDIASFSNNDSPDLGIIVQGAMALFSPYFTTQYQSLSELDLSQWAVCGPSPRYIHVLSILAHKHIIPGVWIILNGLNPYISSQFDKVSNMPLPSVHENLEAAKSVLFSLASTEGLSLSDDMPSAATDGELFFQFRKEENIVHRGLVKVTEKNLFRYIQLYIMAAKQFRDQLDWLYL